MHISDALTYLFNLKIYAMKKTLLTAALTFGALFAANAQTTVLYGVTYDVSNWPVAKVVASENPSTVSENVIIMPEVEYDGKTYSVNSIAASAFDSTDIQSIVIPEGILAVGDDCFANTTALTKVVFPNSVTTYGDRLFNNAVVEEVTYGTGTEEIGWGQFVGDKNLRTVTCLATKVPNAKVSFFDDGPESSATLFVPAESLDDYKTADGWRYFGTIKALETVNHPATSITLPESEVTLEIGQTYVITPMIEPTDYTNTLFWTSDDDTVATVKNGTVTAVSPGVANITATVGTLSATCKVTVSASVGVDEINSDNAAPAVYYNMQGVRLVNPEKGQMVIVRQGDKTYKTVVR